MEKGLSKDLQESLKRHRELLGYDPTKGTSSLNEGRYRHTYPATDGMTDYADDEEETTETEETTDTETEGGEDNADFDFGGDTEGGDAEGGDNADFDFGGDEETDTEETDEFGTADEFSAADDLEGEESDEEVEEIDVTDIVKKADDAKGYSERAVKAAEEGKNMIHDLMSKFDTLQSTLSKIDTVANELNGIKRDLQSQKPKEKLELRSLDSYPFNVKLTDYWNDEKLKDNYEITSGAPDAKSKDGEVKVWKLDPKEAKDFSNVDIKKSFVPESRSKRKVLTEGESEEEILNVLKKNMYFEENPDSGDLDMFGVNKSSEIISKMTNLSKEVISKILERNFHGEENPDSGDVDLYGLERAVDEILSLIPESKKKKITL